MKTLQNLKDQIDTIITNDPSAASAIVCNAVPGTSGVFHAVGFGASVHSADQAGASSTFQQNFGGSGATKIVELT